MIGDLDQLGNEMTDAKRWFTEELCKKLIALEGDQDINVGQRHASRAPTSEQRTFRDEEKSQATVHEKPRPTTLKSYAVAMSEKHRIAKKQANEMLEDFVGMIVKSLKKGEKVKIGGLGIFQVRKQPARIGRNPATGEMIKIQSGKKVAFRASKELRKGGAR